MAALLPLYHLREGFGLPDLNIYQRLITYGGSGVQGFSTVLNCALSLSTLLVCSFILSYFLWYFLTSHIEWQQTPRIPLVLDCTLSLPALFFCSCVTAVVVCVLSDCVFPEAATILSGPVSVDGILCTELQATVAQCELRLLVVSPRAPVCILYCCIFAGALSHLLYFILVCAYWA